MATDQTACGNSNSMKMYNFMGSINNTTIAATIVKEVSDTPRMLHVQKCSNT